MKKLNLLIGVIAFIYAQSLANLCQAQYIHAKGIQSVSAGLGKSRLGTSIQGSYRYFFGEKLFTEAIAGFETFTPGFSAKGQAYYLSPRIGYTPLNILGEKLFFHLHTGWQFNYTLFKGVRQESLLDKKVLGQLNHGPVGAGGLEYFFNTKHSFRFMFEQNFNLNKRASGKHFWRSHIIYTFSF